MKLSLVLAPLFIALLIWVIRTKKYVQALLGTITAGAAFALYVGTLATFQNTLWFGAAMICIGLAALLGVVFALLRLRSAAGNKCFEHH